MIYDLIDAKRQWQNYLTNLKLFNVPVFGTPSSTAAPGGGEESLFLFSILMKLHDNEFHQNLTTADCLV